MCCLFQYDVASRHLLHTQLRSGILHNAKRYMKYRRLRAVHFRYGPPSRRKSLYNIPHDLGSGETMRGSVHVSFISHRGLNSERQLWGLAPHKSSLFMHLICIGGKRLPNLFETWYPPRLSIYFSESPRLEPSRKEAGESSSSLWMYWPGITIQRRLEIFHSWGELSWVHCTVTNTATSPHIPISIFINVIQIDMNGTFVNLPRMQPASRFQGPVKWMFKGLLLLCA
jgi:hypothetical protein